MKIMTLGISPYLHLSDGRLHAAVLECLFKSKHSVASIGTNHDTSYFLPEKNENGDPVYYYEFDGYKIPLIPFNSVQDHAVGIHEILKVFEPDAIVTIGDINDFLYMKAVKMFSDKPIKWLSILSNHTYPINENNVDIVNDMDGIVCTNKSSFDMVKKLYHKESISTSHVGGFSSDVKPSRDSSFRIIVTAKNTQSDNIPTIMEAASKVRSEIPELQLYLHTNVYDRGDFDLNLLKSRFDPKNEFIKFPDKYVSMNEAYSDSDFKDELSKCDMFISASSNAPTGMSAYDAISCGCVPLMSNVGAHKDIASSLSEISPQFERNDFLVPCIEIMTGGEVYANICDSESLRERILNLRNKIKGGNKILFQQFIDSYDQKNFLNEVSKMIKTTECSNPTLCVETV
jgi:hypothetical protein